MVWNSPWREYEYASLDYYQADGRYHVIGHVPVIRIEDGYWPRKYMPDMPQIYHDPVHLIGYTPWGWIDVVSASTGEMAKRYGFVYVNKYDDGSADPLLFHALIQFLFPKSIKIRSMKHGKVVVAESDSCDQIHKRRVFLI